jgi:hypothetical protein
VVCRKCGADALRRENRRGFLQLKVFPLFGLYPWECIMCRRVGMHFAAGRRLDAAPQRTNPPLKEYRRPTK